MRVLTVALLLLLTGACRDDFMAGGEGEEVITGKPAKIILNIAVDDMVVQQMTRSFIDEDAANFCQDVWIGIYNADTGECTYNELIQDPADVNENVSQKYGLGRFEIPTTSGMSRIVAVANSTTRYGIASTDHDPVKDKVHLSALLSQADTWEKFRNIVVLRSDTSEINIFSPDLCMSGYYTEDKTNLKETETDNIPAYNITPGEHALDGVLYLRRQIAYSKFKVYAGPNVNLEVLTWRVCNNAACCYLFEQPTVAADPLDWYGTSEDMHAVTSEADGSYSFEAYLLANKETATPYQEFANGDYVGIRPDEKLAGLTAAERIKAQYNDREREFSCRNAKGERMFKSLVADSTARSGEALYSNTATYVEISTRVTYYIDDTDDNRAHPENGTPVAYDASKKQIFREGRITYTIHLGYCYGQDEKGNATYETACDFNVRRNTKYTYNITVNGVKDIVVEARGNNADQPGSHGDVADAYDSHILVDAHYGVFNISLSNVDRNGMGYHLAVPFGGQTVEFDQNTPATQTDGLEFFNWIQFRPTTGKEVLATYSPSDVWSLRELANPTTYPHGSGGATALNDTTQQWYTVFIDEYVYHQDLSGATPTSGTENLWRNYVNQNNRVCELVVSNYNKQGSAVNSSYTSSRYVVSQRSIQTYYKEIDGGSNTGVGIEHTNESYGLNMRFLSISNANAHDGRMNTVNACYRSNGGNGLWSNVVDFTTPMHVYAGTNSTTYHSHEAADYAVPSLKVWGTTHYSADPSPSDNRWFYANLACMNRNRDLNGDGKITGNEVKWYLPSYWGYVRIMAGQMELPSPLMDWDKYSTTLFYDEGRASIVNGRQCFHYITSDGRYLWAEEGMSVGDGVYQYVESYPYEMRCVRNLGTSIKEYTSFNTSDNPETTAPFTLEGNIITMTYYMDNCCRSVTGSYLPAHAINSYANRPARSFEVSADYCKGITCDYGYVYVDEDGYLYGDNTKPSNDQEWIDVWTNSLTRNTLCRKYTQASDKSDLESWRVPSQLELTFMQMSGFIASGDNVVCATHEYFDTYPDSTNKNKFLGISKDIMTRSIFEYQLKGQKIKVRCVRDVY